MTIGERLKFWRKKQGLSGAALGARLGVSQASVASWETSARQIMPDNLVALYYMGLNLNWLLVGEGEMYVDATGKTEADVVNQLREIKARLRALEERQETHPALEVNHRRH